MKPVKARGLIAGALLLVAGSTVFAGDAFAGDAAQAAARALVASIERGAGHGAREQALHALAALESLDPSIAVPSSTVVACLDDPERDCREAALALLVVGHAQHPGWLDAQRDAVRTAVAKLATSQRLTTRERAARFLEAFVGEKRDAAGWAQWLLAEHADFRLPEVVAIVSSGTLNGERVTDVDAALAALEARADVAGVPFVQRRWDAPSSDELFLPPLLELAPMIPDARWAEEGWALLARSPEHLSCEPGVLRERAEALDHVIRALRHSTNDPTQVLAGRRDAYLAHAKAHELLETTWVTGIVVDPRRKSHTIIVLGDDVDRRGRIYSEGDELHDKDDRRMPGFKVLKIQEGTVSLSVDGEVVTRELKPPR